MPTWTTDIGAFATDDVLEAADMTLIRENFQVDGSAWTSYTPTWTTTGTAPAIGNGTLAGAYVQTGKTVRFRAKLTAGSTTTFGTGTWSLSLPVTAKAADTMVVSGWIFDSGTRHYVAVGKLTSTTTLSIIHTESGNSGQVDATSPQTWANGDFLVVTGVYEAA